MNAKKLYTFSFALFLCLVVLPNHSVTASQLPLTLGSRFNRYTPKVLGGIVASGSILYGAKSWCHNTKVECSTALHTRPVYDKIGYAWSPIAMNSLGKYLEKEQGANASLPFLPVGGICPHNDHLFAGHLYYQFFKEVKAKHIVIFGVSHGRSAKAIDKKRNIIILDTYDQWDGTYGAVKIADLREKIKEEMRDSYAVVSDKAHAKEHSIEAMLPFIQYFQSDAIITPIIVRSMDADVMDDIAENLAGIMADYIKKHNLVPGKDIFFLCSSDSTHYGSDFDNTFYGEGVDAHARAVHADLEATKHLIGELTAEKIKNFTQEGVVIRGWCGRYSIPFGALVIEKTFNKMATTLNGHLLGYSDTLSDGIIPLNGVGLGVTSQFNVDHWVGHLGVMFAKQAV